MKRGKKHIDLSQQSVVLPMLLNSPISEGIVPLMFSLRAKERKFRPDKRPSSVGRVPPKELLDSWSRFKFVSIARSLGMVPVIALLSSRRTDNSERRKNSKGSVPFRLFSTSEISFTFPATSQVIPNQVQTSPVLNQAFKRLRLFNHRYPSAPM